MADIEGLIKRTERFEEDRTNWDNQYQDCADYAMPQNNQFTRKKAKGQTATIDLFDTTAEESNIQLAAGLYSYMFPTEGKAFVLEIDDEELGERDDVKQWLEKVTKIIHKYLVSSNFRQAFFEFLKSLGCFGTACLYEAKGKTEPLVFTTFHMAGVYISQNSDHIVDTVFRTFDYTARQAVQEFGYDNVHEDIQKAFDSDGDKEKEFAFIHAVYPRSDYDTTKDDPINMPWASVWIDREHKEEIEESGYPELPYQVDRFDRDALETYGRSPTMKKLPDIKMANKMQQIRIKGWDKMVDPPVLLPDDGSIWPLATAPASTIYYRAGGEKPEYWKFEGNLSEMEKAILTVQESIQKGYFLDKFDPLIDKQNMTATEVNERVQQTLRFLIPVIGRLQSELFNPMITRIIGILGKQGKLPDAPPELAEQDFSVMYLGRIALSLRMLETEGMTRTLQMFEPLASMNIVDWLDNLNQDEAFRDAFRNNGASVSHLFSEDEVQNTRQARAEAQKQQALLDQAGDLSKAAKNLNEKPVEGSMGEGLGEMLGG